MKRLSSCLLACTFFVGLSALPAYAQTKDLLVMGIESHQNNLRAMGFAEGGVDTLDAFEAANGIKVQFSVNTGAALEEGLQRVGALARSEEDLIYVAQLSASPRIRSFLEPLDAYMAANPIASFPEQWSPGVVKAASIDGKLYLLPVRCGTFTLWSNSAILAERGIAAAPTTPEELYAAAKAATYTKPNGEQVFGFSTRGEKFGQSEDLAIIARMFGGNLVDADGKVVINSPEVVKAVEFLRRMFVEGIMPPNWVSADVGQMFRDERLAMAFGGGNYGSQLQGGGAAVAGKAVPSYPPLEASLKTADISYSPSVLWFWGIGIFKGSTDKDMAYNLIHHIGDPVVQQEMANNGNAPCTADALAKAAEKDEGMRMAADIMKISSPPLPAHPRINQVRDMLGIAVQDMIANGAPIQESLDKLAAEMTDILGS
jgi:multiple sugar transport system substrate-binding protein